MKKDFIRLSGMLCIITLVASLLLAGVNTITKARIEEASNQASEKAMQEIMTEADTFENISGNVYECKKGTETVGYCTTVEAKGFGGEISVMVGIGTDGTVQGIDVLSHSETPGLGAKSDTDEFKNRFCGKNSKLSVVKTPTQSTDEVQAITGATITSRAVSKAVEDAAKEIDAVKGGNK